MAHLKGRGGESQKMSGLCVMYGRFPKQNEKKYVWLECDHTSGINAYIMEML